MGQTSWEVLAVATGAALGALVRWQAGVRLGLAPGGMPIGTLVVNLAGGCLVGLALAWFALHPEQQAWRLFCVVGFLGGLTTFSAFSGESLYFLIDGRPVMALLHAALHVLGALAMSAIGYAVGRRLLG